MTRFIANYVCRPVSSLLLAGLLLLSAPLLAEPTPLWLQQLAGEKHQAPQRVLTQLQEQQMQFLQLNEMQQAYWLNIQATAYSHLGRYPEQQQAALQGLALLDDKPSVLKAELLYELGYAREMQLALNEALNWYQQGLAIAQQLNETKLRLRGVINIAAVDSLQDRDQQALQALKQAYQEAQQLQDKEILAEVNAQLGLMYSALALEQEALDFLEQALTLYDELGWQKNKITVLYNLARNYSALNKADLALQSFERMLQSAQAEQDLLSMYYAYSGLAITSNEMERAQIALHYMEKAEEYLELIQSTYYLAGHHFEKALIYQKLQQNSLALQQLQLAEDYMQQQEKHDAGNMLLALKLLKAELLAGQGQFERAYQQLYSFVGDYQQLRDKETEVELAKVRLGFDSEREVARQSLSEQTAQLDNLKQLESAHSRQIRGLWLALIVSSSLLFILFIQLRRQRRKTTTQESQ